MGGQMLTNVDNQWRIQCKICGLVFQITVSILGQLPQVGLSIPLRSIASPAKPRFGT
jgi:hypothetical protein